MNKYKRWVISYLFILVLHLLIIYIVNHRRIIPSHYTKSEKSNLYINLTESFYDNKTINIQEEIEKLKNKEAKYKVFVQKSTIIEKEQKIIEKEKTKKETENLEKIENEQEKNNINLQKQDLSGEELLSIKNSYLENIYKQIEKNKFYPTIEKRKMNEGTVKVKFTLHSNGEISNVVIISPSRYSSFNESAKQSIYNSLPFSAFPIELKEESIEILIELIYELK
jgi:TonB family protein